MLETVFFVAFMLKRTLAEVAGMTLDEFNHWLAFFRLNPCGPLVDDARHSVLAAMTHNGHFATKQSQCRGPADFTLIPKRVVDEDRLYEKSRAAFAAMGALDLTKGDNGN